MSDRFDRELRDVENLLAERLSIIEEGKGHWAECIQAIEQFGRQCHSEGKREGRKEAFEEAADYCLVAKVNRVRMKKYLDAKAKAQEKENGA